MNFKNMEREFKNVKINSILFVSIHFRLIRCKYIKLIYNTSIYLVFYVIDGCRKNQKMLFSLNRKLDLVLNLLTNSNTVLQTNKQETELLPDFPLATIEEFSKFEADLQSDREIRKQFVSIFLCIF